jgi:hypothetical protein
VNTPLLQRQAALAGVALLAVLGALALARDESPGTGAPETVAPAVRWRTALAGISTGGRATCETPIDASTRGVIHPVLPCGAKLVVRANGRSIRTEVVGQRPAGIQHEFDLTPALAAELGVEVPSRIRWRFAG